MDWAAPLIRDADAIRAIVPIPNVDQCDVQFYLQIGRAVLIAPTLDRELTDDELRSINKKSNWDVFVFSKTRFDEIKTQANEKFVRTPYLNADTSELLLKNAYFGYDDLSVVDPEWLAEHCNIDSQAVDAIIEHAEIEAERLGGDGV